MGINHSLQSMNEHHQVDRLSRDGPGLRVTSQCGSFRLIHGPILDCRWRGPKEELCTQPHPVLLQGIQPRRADLNGVIAETIAHRLIQPSLFHGPKVIPGRRGQPVGPALEERVLQWSGFGAQRIVGC